MIVLLISFLSIERGNMRGNKINYHLKVIQNLFLHHLFKIITDIFVNEDF